MSNAQWNDVSAALIATVEQAIQQVDDELRTASLSIHAHPELCWNEHHAHDVLTALMEKHGFDVERHAYGFQTAWKATYEVGKGGRTIGFNSEMDALPGIGHACGHNLIAISGCAAAIGAAAALRQHQIPGKVVLLGTPAEEGGGGKVKLLDAGAYDGMSACLMVHPGTGGHGSGSATSTAIVGFDVTYHGKGAHAGGAPEKGINALDAAVSAYVNLSVLRQQVPGSHRIQGVIAGSEKWSANVIPAEARLKYGVRTPTARELMEVVPKIINCFKAGALSSGCTYEISEHCKSRWGAEGYLSPGRSATSASTDFGDVTYRLPGLHPMFLLPNALGGEYPHSGSYAGVAKGPEAHQAALKAASAIAVVGARVIVDDGFASDTTSTWRKQMDDIQAEETRRKIEQLLRPFQQGNACKAAGEVPL